jgi:hypothetical protein
MGYASAMSPVWKLLFIGAPTSLSLDTFDLTVHRFQSLAKIAGPTAKGGPTTASTADGTVRWRFLRMFNL